MGRGSRASSGVIRLTMYPARQVIQEATTAGEERQMTGRQDSKGGQARVVRSACAYCLLALAMGCSGNNNLQPDPLTGNQPPVPVAGPAVPASVPVKSDPATPLPALAAPSAAGSTAALAAATTPRPDGKPDVRIGPPPTAKLASATAVGTAG